MRGIPLTVLLPFAIACGAKTGLYVPDADLFFRLAPDLEVSQTGNPRIFDLRTDSRGLRSAEVDTRL